jgi:hypothetical protein
MRMGTNMATSIMAVKTVGDCTSASREYPFNVRIGDPVSSSPKTQSTQIWRDYPEPRRLRHRGGIEAS